MEKVLTVKSYEWAVPRFVVMCHILGKEESVLELSLFGRFARVVESSLFKKFGLGYEETDRYVLNRFFVDLLHGRVVDSRLLMKLLMYASDDELRKVYTKGSGITTHLKTDMGLLDYCEHVYSDLLEKHASDMRDFLNRTGAGTFERVGERMFLSLEGSSCDFEDILWSASKFDCDGKVITMVPIIL